MSISTRINYKIQAREVRAIDSDGKQLGILPLNKAIKMAEEKNLDLVEVAPNVVPPVCRIMDYGKYRYEQNKRQKESYKHQHAVKLKEIRLRPNIEPHDYAVKLEHGKEFLGKRYKVKINLLFRGREIVHRHAGLQLLNKFIEDLKEYGLPEAETKSLGKIVFITLGPVARRKPDKE